MSYLSSFYDGSIGFLWAAAMFIIVMTFIVFIHEFGHFIVGRWCGVKIDEFSIGFGKELIGTNDKHGTRWKFCLLPLGGFVKFAGDMNPASVPDKEALATASDDERAGLFHYKPLWQRAAIVAAGPIANFLLAIALYAGIYYVNGSREISAHIDTIVADSPAEAAGFKSGDLVTKIGTTPINSFADMQRIVSSTIGVPLTFTVERDGTLLDIVANPKLKTLKTRFGDEIQINMLGISRSTDNTQVTHVTYGLFGALKKGVGETWFIIERTCTFLKNLVLKRESPKQLSGPLGIGKMVGQVADIGVNALIHMAALLSVSIGFLNLFPIPMLDGGHLVFYGLEAIRGKALSEKAMEWSFKLGIFLLLSLMVYTTAIDLTTRIFN